MLQMFLLLLSVEERGGAARSQFSRIIKKIFRASQVCIWRLLVRNITEIIIGSPFRHPQYDMLYNSTLVNSSLSILSLFWRWYLRTVTSGKNKFKRTIIHYLLLSRYAITVSINNVPLEVVKGWKNLGTTLVSGNTLFLCATWDLIFFIEQPTLSCILLVVYMSMP